ncbi:MAG TPA: SHOCT domain-containing protein, partial [Dehalococcoidia bacterium]|nr:SHOCT domain-containing protein [Dehalococcoidia bacterium]
TMAVMPLLWPGMAAPIAWAVWAASRRGRESGTPLDLLQQSYARGQITHDQFERMKKDLAWSCECRRVDFGGILARGSPEMTGLFSILALGGLQALDCDAPKP